ncbi:MAG: hypothetical protein N2510_06895 [Ignavibacteria bacterium]|nr:hypothetical protein [Ignavibacteria bacterium]
MKFRRPKGTKDILPEESWKWQIVESNVREVMNLFNYSEIRTQHLSILNFSKEV